MVWPQLFCEPLSPIKPWSVPYCCPIVAVDPVERSGLHVGRVTGAVVGVDLCESTHQSIGPVTGAEPCALGGDAANDERDGVGCVNHEWAGDVLRGGRILACD